MAVSAACLALGVQAQNSTSGSTGTSADQSSQPNYQSGRQYGGAGRMGHQEVRASKLMGADVKSSQGQSLGTINDVIFNPASGRIDFAEVTTGKRLPLIHPGEILRDDFLKPLKISVYTLALAIKVPRSRLNDIVLGRRGITADTAFRLARYFGTTPGFWINLQARYDLDAADRKLRRRIEREVRPRAA